MLNVPGDLGLSQTWLWSEQHPLAEALAAAASASALHPVLHPQQLPLPTLSWEPQPRPDCGGPPSSQLPCSAVPKAEPDPLSICGGQRQGSHKPQA